MIFLWGCLLSCAACISFIGRVPAQPSTVCSVSISKHRLSPCCATFHCVSGAIACFFLFFFKAVILDLTLCKTRKSDIRHGRAHYGYDVHNQKCFWERWHGDYCGKVILNRCFSFCGNAGDLSAWSKHTALRSEGGIKWLWHALLERRGWARGTI